MRARMAWLLVCGCACSSSPGSSSNPDAGNIAALSDTFDGTALDPSWTVLHPEAVAITVANHALTLRLIGPAFWFNTSQGVLVSKPVTGNFKITATVHARKASAPTMPPGPPVHLGGLMARNPAPGSENYVFIVVGHDPNSVAIETKNTTNSSSQYSGVAWPSGDAQLRLCRMDASFQLLKRSPGADAWVLAATFARPDLPATLQVGPNIYSSASTPDVQVSFDGVIFANVGAVSDCSTD